MPTGGVDVFAGAGALAGAFGEAAPFIGAGLAGAEGGAALGGLSSAITGGNFGKGILHGAEAGALTGGGIGLAGSALGGTLGTTAADVLGGTAGGALGAKVTGGNPLTGALEGGISGGIASQLAPSTTSAAPASGGAGASAGGISAPASTLDPSTLNPDTFSSLSPSLASASDAASVGSSLSTGSNVGSGTTGTPSISNGGGSPLFSSTLSSPVADNIASGLIPASPSSVSQFLSNPSFGAAGNVIASNPGAVISAGGLAADALQSGKSLEGERQLKSQAAGLANQGNQLEGYLQSGTLPPGLQAGITQASDAAKATIRSQYASRGQSGSSAEQQDLAAVDQRAEAQGAQMAMQLLQTGISETGMASGLYEQLLNQATKSDEQLGSAISNFASAAAGGGQAGRGGITVNYSGNA